MYVCMCVFVRLSICHACFIQKRVYIQRYIHIYIYMHTHIYIHNQKHIHVYALVYLHAHITTVAREFFCSKLLPEQSSA